MKVKSFRLRKRFRVSFQFGFWAMIRLDVFVTKIKVSTSFQLVLNVEVAVGLAYKCTYILYLHKLKSNK